MPEGFENIHGLLRCSAIAARSRRLGQPPHGLRSIRRPGECALKFIARFFGAARRQ
jgi:hypothetical protein